MGNPVEDYFALALVSKFQNLSFSYHDLFVFLTFLAFFRLLLVLVHWAHPGGPAWGQYYHFLGRSRSAGPIPGPSGVPVVGSMSIMASPLAHRALAACAESFCARRLMAFSLGQSRLVITSDPEVAREILNGPNFANRPFKESAQGLMFDRAMGFAPFGSYWRTLRKIAAAHLLCSKQVAASEIHRREIADQMSSIICSSVADGLPFITIRDTLRQASLCNMMSSVFGRRYKLGCGIDEDKDMQELRRMVDTGYDLLGKFNWSDHLPWISGLDIQGVRRGCSELVPQVRRFLTQIIQEHRDIMTNQGGVKSMDFLHVLMSLEGKDKLEDDDMIAVLWEMIFRGTDTVAVLIEWVLARMVIHPEIQSKVQNELDRVTGRSRRLMESDLQSTPFLTSVVKEVLRLHPPGPLLSWARLATEDTTIGGGHVVPRGTIALVNMWAIMRDPKLWSDPLEFEPERFVTKGASGDMDSWLSGSDLRWAPFGSGRRVCPGKSMGLTAASHWVGRLLQEFEWVRVDEHPVDLSEVLRLSCEMANPLAAKVRLRRR